MKQTAKALLPISRKIWILIKALLIIMLIILPLLELFLCFFNWFPESPPYLDLTKQITYLFIFIYLGICASYIVLLFRFIVPILYGDNNFIESYKTKKNAVLLLVAYNFTVFIILLTPNFIIPLVKCGNSYYLVSYSASGSHGSFINEFGKYEQFRTDSYGNWTKSVCIKKGYPVIIRVSGDGEGFATCSIYINGFYVKSDRAIFGSAFCEVEDVFFRWDRKYKKDTKNLIK